MFSVNRLGLSPSLTRCLVSIYVIESPHSGGVLPVAREEDRAPLGCRPAHDRKLFSVMSRAAAQRSTIFLSRHRQDAAAMRAFDHVDRNEAASQARRQAQTVDREHLRQAFLLIA